jgi:hypothetical protein
MTKTLIDIGIACSGAQSPRWWSANFGNLLKEVQYGNIEIDHIMAISSALPDWNKNEAIGQMALDFAPLNEKKRNQITDGNRNRMTRNFMKSQAEWLLMIDDDTVLPEKAVTNLLRTGKKFVAGLYYNPNPPKNPIAYVRNPEGVGYYALYGWTPGSLIEVDSVGMGCTLIHKDVFRAILEGYDVVSRPNGSLMPLQKSAFVEGVQPTRYIGLPDIFVSEGWMYTKVRPLEEDDNRMWPFYSMEYGRTEDHHFCEMAATVGFKPWVDTTINCGHIKSWSMEYKDYREYANESEGL